MLKQLMELVDLPPVEVGHLGMEKRGRLVRFDEEGFQVAFALLHDEHLRVQAIGGTASQDHVDKPIEVGKRVLEDALH